MYSAACIYAHGAAATGKDDELPPAERTKLEENYAADALRLLRDAMAQGFRDIARVKQDADLNTLRTREDFQQLVRDLEAGVATGETGEGKKE